MKCSNDFRLCGTICELDLLKSVKVSCANSEYFHSHYVAAVKRGSISAKNIRHDLFSFNNKPTRITPPYYPSSHTPSI